MKHIVVSYAGADKTAAGLVIGKLKRLGHTVTPVPAVRNLQPLRRHRSGGDVLVLWSRHYANMVRRPTPALATLRLDGAPPPPRSRTIDLRAWRGRDDHRGWRAVLATLAPPAVASARPASPSKPRASAPEPKMKQAAETKEYTGPQFIHLAVMLVLLAAMGGAVWQFLPH